MKLPKKVIGELVVRPGSKARLAARSTSGTDLDRFGPTERSSAKEIAERDLEEFKRELGPAQELLYASDTWAVLVVIQGIDASGKDGTIKHVLSGVDPQGCEVVAFSEPSAVELHHDYLWRCVRELPERGRIGIFNRSYYEDVLVVRVHPELLAARRLPPGRPIGPCFLGGALRGHQRIRAPPRPQRHSGGQALPAPLEGRATSTVPQTPRRSGQAMEVLAVRSEGSAVLRCL